MSTTTAPVVAERGTAWSHLVVRRAGPDEHLWDRTAGPDRVLPPHPAPLAGLVPDPATDHEGSDDPGVALRLPTDLPDGVRYRTAGGESLLAVAAGSDGPGRAAAALHATGRALGRLHGVTLPPCRPADGPLPQTARLDAWLTGGPAPRGAARLRTELRGRLGPDRTARLEAWSTGARRPGPALLHGAPGLGLLVPAPVRSDRPADLLTGEDVTSGPRGHDVGWLLGELVELVAAGGRTDLAVPARAFADGYGYGAPAPPGTARTCALRLAVHLHDFAAYVGWHPDLPARLGLLASLIDDPRAVLDEVLEIREQT